MLDRIRGKIAAKKRKEGLRRSLAERHSFAAANSQLDGADISDYVALFGGVFRNAKIGRHTYIGDRAFMPNTLVGNFCSIAEGVRVVYARHPLAFVSSYPGFYRTLNTTVAHFNENLSFDELLKTKAGYYAEIGNDVWIGDNVLIKGGVVIGDGAVVGMGSVVTHDVPPYAIVAGAPARIIRFRFSEDEISFLRSTEWWKWDEDKLRRFAPFFNDPASLKEALFSDSKEIA